MSSSPSTKLRNHMQELEDEVKFLREQNYHIQQLSDTYRERVSNLLAAIQFKSNVDTSLAFPTVTDLEELVGRLRSRDIPRVSSSASPPMEHKVRENTPNNSLNREDDVGLIQSTSTLSHITPIEEEEVEKMRTRGNGKSKISGKRGKTHTTQNAPLQEAQHSIMARLMAENKNLASLVDTLKFHLSTATRVNNNLKKKLKSLSSSENRSHSSPGGRKYGAAAAAAANNNKMPGSSPLQKKLRDLEEENERLRVVVENGEQMA
ncbi:hypothetical protein LSM04_004272 [Trypanosoma melophagium]|uniref:uncharacterized protein n=1 Tax=Trypanosoma melophagium TaxID=715481 RepID=UPI00351A2438|nr:hypothetical protein LSM04_004272 [Trypanosoma melophagium]